MHVNTHGSLRTWHHPCPEQRDAAGGAGACRRGAADSGAADSSASALPSRNRLRLCPRATTPRRAQGGNIKVWRLSQGQCVRRLGKAHEQGVTCLAFSRDGLQLVSGSFDGTARLHGLRSGKTLREFRGHSSFVNDVLWSTDGGRVVTASSDGSAKVWDAKSAECICTLRPPHTIGAPSPALCSIALWPANAEYLAVCSKASAVHLLSMSGQLVKSFEAPAGAADFVHCAVSPRGEWLYCAGTDQQLHCFSTASGKVERSLKATEKDLIGVAHHPFRNLVATWGCDALLRLWVP